MKRDRVKEKSCMLLLTKYVIVTKTNQCKIILSWKKSINIIIHENSAVDIPLFPP